MNQSQTGGLLLALTISASLAVGYVAGRLSQDPDATSRSLISNTSAGSFQPGERSGALREQLNPLPQERELPRTESTSTFGRYTSSNRSLAGVAEGAADASYPPRRIGVFVDPDEPRQYAFSAPRHIGRHVDPDAPWIETHELPQVVIGEFIEPER